MVLLIAPVLFTCAVLYVAYPLLRQAAEEQLVKDPASWDSAKHEKDTVIEELRDIEMDFHMGKLSKQDYEALKSDFEHRAVDVFKKLEKLQKGRGKSGKKQS